MLKGLLIPVLLVFGVGSFGQKIPSDSALLVLLYGQVNADGVAFTRPLQGQEEIPEWSMEDSLLTFKVLTHLPVLLNKEPHLVVLTEAGKFRFHGHRWGFRHEFILKQKGNQWVIAHANQSEESTWLGYPVKQEIADIGPERKGLMLTYDSDGNGHYEANTAVAEITPNGLNWIGSLDLSYSNLAFSSSDPDEEGNCELEDREGEYEVNPDSGDGFYDLLVRQQCAVFDKKCEAKPVPKEVTHTYRFQAGVYKKIEKED